MPCLAFQLHILDLWTYIPYLTMYYIRTPPIQSDEHDTLIMPSQLLLYRRPPLVPLLPPRSPQPLTPPLLLPSLPHPRRSDFVVPTDDGTKTVTGLTEQAV